MMAKDSKNQEDNQFIELPEDRIDQIGFKESHEKTGKKSKRASSASGKTGRKQEADSDVLNDAEDEFEKVEKEPKRSRDDLLDDIRKELAGEEDVVEEKGFFGRFKDRLKKVSEAKTEETESYVQSESGLQTQEELRDLVIEPQPKKKKRSSTSQEEKAVQEFFSDLEALADVVHEESEPKVVKVREALPEIQTEVEEKLIPKLPAKSKTREEIDFEKVREVALQEYDDTYVEPKIERKVPLQEEVRKTIREAKPLERVLMIVAFILTVGMLLFSGVYIIVKSIPVSTPSPTAVINLDDIVYPTHVNLPGGWGFNLGQGRVNDGIWSPKGAEWLVGTEVSRWVALPWSLQLEAVLRTLKSGDQIELTMSNLDRLEYKVYSIQELTMDEIQAQDPKVPALLIILFEEEGEANTHWVVTALP